MTTTGARARSAIFLSSAYGFFVVAGLAGNRIFLLGAAAVAALGIARTRRRAPAQN
jgi:hypothetical protein